MLQQAILRSLRASEENGALHYWQRTKKRKEEKRQERCSALKELRAHCLTAATSNRMNPLNRLELLLGMVDGFTSRGIMRAGKPTTIMSRRGRN